MGCRAPVPKPTQPSAQLSNNATKPHGQPLSIAQAGLSTELQNSLSLILDGETRGPRPRSLNEEKGTREEAERVRAERERQRKRGVKCHKICLIVSL
jgi:hypothetical protein